MILDKLENLLQYTQSIPGFSKAIHYLAETNFSLLQPSVHEIDGKEIYAIITEYETRDAKDNFPEAHQKYIDVQYMVSGEELIGYANIENKAVYKAYDEKNDFALYQSELSFFHMQKGMVAVFYPHDLHLPCITVTETQKVKKVVVKIKI